MHYPVTVGYGGSNPLRIVESVLIPMRNDSRTSVGDYEIYKYNSYIAGKCIGCTLGS